MKKLLLASLATLLALGVHAGLSPRSASANVICVTVNPVYVHGKQITDQYQVCVPAP